MGAVLRHEVDLARGSLSLLGACFLASALVVVLARLAPGGNKSTTRWTGALMVGVAQGTAVLPGISRPAVTIASLLWLGVGAERAFELSLLASLPAIAVGIAIESRHALRGDESPAAMAVALGVAFLAGLAGLFAMRRVVTAGKLHWFAFYLVPVAVATLAWGYARP